MNVSVCPCQNSTFLGIVKVSNYEYHCNMQNIKHLFKHFEKSFFKKKKLKLQTK